MPRGFAAGPMRGGGGGCSLVDTGKRGDYFRQFIGAVLDPTRGLPYLSVVRSARGGKLAEFTDGLQDTPWR